MTRLRVGLIGIDHFHATGWAESVAQFADRLEPVALYDPNPEIARSLAPAFCDPSLPAALPDAVRGLPFYSDLDTLLREQPLDLAIVTLLNRDAPAAIERLAAAGVHLLVDKPGAKTAPEATRAFAVARAAGVKVAVGLTKRHGPGWRDARAAIAAGRLGRLLSAEAVFVSSSVAVRNPANHLFDRELSGGGVLHWIGIHDLDALLWLASERVVELQAMTASVGHDGLDVEDVVSLALRFASGAIATVHYAYALPRPGSDGYLALRGSRSSVKITPDGNVTWFGPADAGDPIASQQTTYAVRAAPGYGAAALAIIDDLLAAIRDDRDPAATGEDLVRALELVDAAYLAARTGGRVRL